MNSNTVKLFDRIFKPQHIELPNGHTIDRPRSRTPLIFAIVIICMAFSIMLTNFNIGLIIERGNQFTVILKKIFNPNWTYLSKVVEPLFDTIRMSLLGTIIGCIIALPFAVISSSNVNKNKPLLMVFRFILSIVRTFPTIVLCSVASLVFGLGTFAGMVAISIFTFGVVSKMLYESIETIDMGPFEAIEALGGSKFESFWSACIPQILPTYLSHCLYCFEMNIRAAAILGYVGAGGLGIIMQECTGWRDYESLGTVLVILFITVLSIDFFSSFLRKKLS